MISVPAKATRDDDPGHTAVVVIDVQNDFCAPGGFYDLTGGDTARIHAHFASVVSADAVAGAWKPR